MAESSFSANIAAFVAKTGIRADQVLRKLALDALTGVVMRTPVDTGRCRGSWRVSFNTPDTSVEAVKDYPHGRGVDQPGPGGTVIKAGPAAAAANAAKGGGKALSTGGALIAAAKWGTVIYITNNLPYALPLEYGHSKQAPAGMLRVTFAEITASISRAVVAAGGTP